jgi:cytochrome P450
MTETQEAPPGVCPVHFDHYTQAFAADPWTVYTELRTTQPMAWSDQQGGFWVVTSDELIRAISKDHEHFSARFASVPKGLYGADLMVWPPMTMDPPEHTKVKKLMLPAFTPGRAKIFEPELREFCRSMAESFADRDVVDVSHDYARRIPMYLISKMLGVTSEMEDQFADWLHRLVERGMAVDPEDAQKAALEFMGFLWEQINHYREHPAENVISYLCESEIDGEKLSDGDLMGSIFFLIVAGVDTTWSTVGEFLWHLAQNPEQRRAIVSNMTADPDRMAEHVEELLRLYAPAQVARVVKKDVELGGRQLREGQSVLLCFPSACRDENSFDQADELVLDRPKNDHMAFGAGTHKCLGAWVARMELRIGLEEFLKVYPDYELDESKPMRWAAGQVHGPRQVPVRLPR